jgi:hypothetical protein
VPDPLFEDAGAAEEFVGPNAGEARGGRGGGVPGGVGGGGQDGAPDVSRNKTKKGGRKFISCHYVPAHVQVCSLVWFTQFNSVAGGGNPTLNNPEKNSFSA